MTTQDRGRLAGKVVIITFRPIRSPKWPNRTEPTGRATKAMPKVRKALSA